MTIKSFYTNSRDATRESGVSVATASRYTNDSAPVSPEVAERLEQACDEFDILSIEGFNQKQR